MLVQLPKTSTVGTFATSMLKLSVACWVALAVAAVFVMTLGTDEAWVLNGLRSSLHVPVEDLSTELIVTSGGPFALANLALEWLAGSRVWLHRLVSLVCLGLSFVLILKSLGNIGNKPAPRSATWLMLAPLMAVPGAAEVGTAALGTSMGLCLMLSAMTVWAAPKVSLVWRVITGGLLYGLAAAARFDLVLFGPALLLASGMHVTSSRRLEMRLSLPACAFVGIGMFVFLLNQWIMSLPANAMLPAEMGAATGIEGWALNYPRQLNQWFTLTTFAPLSLLAVMAVSAFWGPQASSEPARADVPRFESLLLATGLVLLAAWLVRAPIPHLRYAFPALFCFAALGALGLQHAVVQSLAEGSSRHFLLCQCVALACLVGSIGTTARSLVMADSDYASWEWTHEIPYDYFRRFEAKQHQNDVTAFLRTELPNEARLYSYVPYALRYLTMRPVVAIERVSSAAAKSMYSGRYLVLTPGVGTYFYMKSATADWIRTNATLVKQIGRYSIYKLPDGTDADLVNLALSRSNYESHPNSQLWFGRH